MTEPQHAERTSARRILWLVVVPVGAALIPLLVLRASDDSLGGLAALRVGVAPLIGGLGALSFSFVAPVRMAPLVPFVAAGALFLFVLLVAACVGVLTPLTLSRLKFDPAVSSAVFVTATTDFFGFLIFLGLATIVLL